MNSDEEDENESKSKHHSHASDTIKWSDELKDFDLEEFSRQQGIKFNISDNNSNQLFGDSVIDTVMTETNQSAQQKQPEIKKTKELKAYWGICIIMDINNLRQIAMS